MRLLRSRRAAHAFTLVELLTVVAIIAILAAILIPTAGAVGVSANKAKTRVQFSQWAAAIEAFRGEYGYTPPIATNHLLDAPAFFAAITGRDYRGEALTGPALAGNAKAISFCAIGESHQVKAADGAALNELCDAFGNSEIVILLDADGNGVIAGAELLRRPVRAGNSVAGFGRSLEPAAERFPTGGLRARVAFYSAGAGNTPNDVVYSWR